MFKVDVTQFSSKSPFGDCIKVFGFIMESL